MAYKNFFVDEYYKEFGNKIKRCEKLYNLNYKTEAAIVLCCYIDALATRTYSQDGRSREKYFRKLLEEEYLQDEDEKQRKELAGRIYHCFRCQWVHDASSKKPSAGIKFIREIEYLDEKGKEKPEKSIVFPWDKMVSATKNIIEKLHEETKSRKREFL